MQWLALLVLNLMSRLLTFLAFPREDDNFRLPHFPGIIGRNNERGKRDRERCFFDNLFLYFLPFEFLLFGCFWYEDKDDKDNDDTLADKRYAYKIEIFLGQIL